MQKLETLCGDYVEQEKYLCQIKSFNTSCFIPIDQRLQPSFQFLDISSIRRKLVPIILDTFSFTAFTVQCTILKLPQIFEKRIKCFKTINFHTFINNFLFSLRFLSLYNKKKSTSFMSLRRVSDIFMPRYSCKMFDPWLTNINA